MRVDFALRARRDLNAIGDWIAQDDPVRALTFIKELERRALALADFPLRSPAYQRTRRGLVRKGVYGRYSIYYLVHADRIEVLHFRHGAWRSPRF